MSLFRRYPWFVAACVITLAFGAVSLTAHRGFALTAFADIFECILFTAVAAAMLAACIARPPTERSFWVLMTVGFSLWACNQASWVYIEVVQRRAFPDPYFFDIVLFVHVVPMIAAVAWRPDMGKRPRSARLSALNFLMLLGWWSFLYAFLVFPHQYVLLNVPAYDFCYNQLYLMENILLAAVLAFAVWNSTGGWRRLYINFFFAATLYAVNSLLLNHAVDDGTYYSGSLHDVPLIAAPLWMAATALSARKWELNSISPVNNQRLKKMIPRLAMLTILSLPLLGLWTVAVDSSPPIVRAFRIFTVLTAMLLLGAFVFLRQYVQDQALVGLLQESRRGYDSQKRLQSQLVQKEKLQSLGTIVAGAAHEINHPLDAILTQSDQLWAREGLSDQQKTLLRKIVTQAQRTRDLVSNLLSFAQQTPGEKALVDLGTLLQRAAQMLEPRYPGGKIRVELAVDPSLPPVSGNVNQLFQVFVEIIENGMDALQEADGGSLRITAATQDAEIVLQFSDTGRGLREPARVFDPFYTTKPVGKGTGLGLSAVFGLVQDHGGHITCQNKPEGGALFIVRLPLAEPKASVAGAAGD
jgi:signal transduction histidine kinase